MGGEGEGIEETDPTASLLICIVLHAFWLKNKVFSGGNLWKTKSILYVSILV
jgi:hypothetical protein